MATGNANILTFLGATNKEAEYWSRVSGEDVSINTGAWNITNNNIKPLKPPKSRKRPLDLTITDELPFRLVERGSPHGEPSEFDVSIVWGNGDTLVGYSGFEEWREMNEEIYKWWGGEGLLNRAHQWWALQTILANISSSSPRTYSDLIGKMITIVESPNHQKNTIDEDEFNYITPISQDILQRWAFHKKSSNLIKEAVSTIEVNKKEYYI